MGLPVSLVIAEIVIQKKEDVILPKIQQLFIFWYRYVDVISCIDPSNINFVLSAIDSVN